MGKLVYGESEDMKRAYDAYFSLGHNRSYELTNKLINVPIRTLQHWGRIFKWEDRVNKYIIEHGDFPSTVDNVPPELVGYLKEGEKGLPCPSDSNFTPEELISKYSISNNSGVMTKAEYRVVLGQMVRDFARRFYDGDVKINSVYELEKLIKLDILLSGEPTSRNEINGTGGAVNNEFYVNIEQTVQDDPNVQELLKAIWRNQTGVDTPAHVSSTPIKRVTDMKPTEMVGRLLMSPTVDLEGGGNDGT